MKLKIKNPYQFFVTYKIIVKYSLNPESYDNYINYGINNCKDIIGDGNYYDEDILGKEYQELADKISNTVFIEFISMTDGPIEYIIYFRMKGCSTYEDIKTSIFSLNKEEFRENIMNLISSFYSLLSRICLLTSY